MTDPNHDPRTTRSDTNVNVTDRGGSSTGPIAMVVVALIVIVALLWVFGVFGGADTVATEDAAGGETSVTIENDAPDASATAGSDAEAEAPAADAGTDAPAADADADAAATTEEAPATE